MKWLKIVLILIPVLFLSCKKDSNLRWTEVNITMEDLETGLPIDSVYFRVNGGKSGDQFINGGSSTPIDAIILNGKYSGGFYTEGTRWKYYIAIYNDFFYKHYFLNTRDNSTYLDKRKVNTVNFKVAELVHLKINFEITDCTIKDRIELLIRHKIYTPSINIEPNSEDWHKSLNRTTIQRCDSSSLYRLYPPGVYDVAVKTFIAGNETYESFTFEIIKDTTNVLNLFY